MYFMRHASTLLSCFVVPFTTRHNCYNVKDSSLLSTLGESNPVTTIQVQLPGETQGDIIDNKSRNEDTYKRFVDWLKSNGAEINDAVELRPSARGAGYGIFVNQDVKKDDILFTIPRDICISLDSVKNDPDCGEAFTRLIDKAGPGGATVAIAGYMAKERLKCLHDQQKAGGNAASQFGPYFSTLPWERGTNGQEHIIFWPDEDIETYLKGTMCYGEATDLRGEVDLAIRVLGSIVGTSILKYRGEISEPDSFLFPWQKKSMAPPDGSAIQGFPEAVRGAFVCLLTRSFQDQDDDVDDDERLVPMLDLMQHSDIPNVRHSAQKEDGSFQISASRDLKQGEELFNQYRPEEEENMPYHRFFTRYGFIPGITEPAINLLKDKSSIFYAQKQEV